MLAGLYQMATSSSVFVRNCNRNIKSSFNATVLFRNKTTESGPANNDQQSIADFYAGKSVFLTGGTGFMGKVFIEKLLYSCKDIDKVYILVRDKKGKSTDERLRQMLNNQIFDRVKKSRPQALAKLVPIVGDIAVPNLGMKPQDEQKLKEEVSVVFHLAATVRFNEPLQVAMNMNFEGTRRLVNLSRRMKKLDNFVYISTAYTQTIHPVLEEKLYPSPAKADDVYKFIQKHNADRKKTNEFIAQRPNTYTFTKAMSEHYVGTCKDLPVTIVRPSVVGATITEPTPGWLDNWFGLTGIVESMARGLNCNCLAQPETKCDVIPVDYVTNLSLIAGAKYNGGRTVPIYNSTSSSINPITLGAMFYMFILEGRSHNSYEKYPYLVFHNSRFMNELSTLLFQTTPAFASDIVLRMKGEKPRHMAIQQRILTARNISQYFMQDWTMKADAAQALFRSLSKGDQKEFPCDPADIDWGSYFKNYFHGIRTHLLPQELKKKVPFKPKTAENVLAN